MSYNRPPPYHPVSIEEDPNSPTYRTGRESVGYIRPSDSYQSQHSNSYNPTYNQDGSFNNQDSQNEPYYTRGGDVDYEDDDDDDDGGKGCCKRGCSCSGGCKCKCTKGCWCSCAIWSAVTIACILVLLFLSVFVVFPLVFMNSYSLQRSVIFLNIDQPSDPEYDNFAKYDVEGVRNFYVEVNEYDGNKEESTSKKIRLGAWQVLPEDEIKNSKHYNETDYIYALRNSKKPVIIYFHGQSGTRIFFYDTYQVLRKYFHVIAFDYRSYGDSTVAPLTEAAVVLDSLQFYEWVTKNTLQTNIYVWGHSLGTALSTHTLRELYKTPRYIRKPKGLILESPFTTMREEMKVHPLMKVFKWLPYFAATFLDPVEDNGFLFKTTENILKVECPVMVIHAEDDSMIPYTLGEEVFNIAYHNRTKKHQAHYNLVPSKLRCNHMGIHKDPKLPQYIEMFLQLAKPEERSLKNLK